MGFNIGSLTKDLGISLPKIDIGSIGKAVLEEGKKLLGDVVKDSFTLSNKPGEVFADQMNLNILGDSVRLPNPVGRLANKLLGGVDQRLGAYGVNIDFKTALSKLFHLPTESGDVVKVPDLKTRIAQAGGGVGAPPKLFTLPVPEAAADSADSVDASDAPDAAEADAAPEADASEAEVEAPSAEAVRQVQAANDLFGVIGSTFKPRLDGAVVNVK